MFFLHSRILLKDLLTIFLTNKTYFETKWVASSFELNFHLSHCQIFTILWFGLKCKKKLLKTCEFLMWLGIMWMCYLKNIRSLSTYVTTTYLSYKHVKIIGLVFANMWKCESVNIWISNVKRDEHIKMGSSKRLLGFVCVISKHIIVSTYPFCESVKTHTFEYVNLWPYEFRMWKIWPDIIVMWKCECNPNVWTNFCLGWLILAKKKHLFCSH